MSGEIQIKASNKGIIIMFESGATSDTEPKQIKVIGKIARFTQIVNITVFTAYLKGLNFIEYINFLLKISFEVQIHASMERNERIRLIENTE